MMPLNLPVVLFLLQCLQSAVVFSFVTRNDGNTRARVNCLHEFNYISQASSRIVLEPSNSRRGLHFIRARDGSKLHAHATLSTIEKEILNLSPEEAQQSLDYLASLIKTHLNGKQSTDESTSEALSDTQNIASILAKDRFIDLTTNLQAEHALENLFTLAPSPSPRIIKYAILSLQSLLIHAMQVGVKGGEEQQKKLVRHLFRRTDPPPPKDVTWVSRWTTEDIRRLKFYRDGELGKQVLASLKWKRTSVGAYELLIHMGIWGKEEEVSLLRSGFPIRFLDEEVKSALEVSCCTKCHPSVDWQYQINHS